MTDQPEDEDLRPDMEEPADAEIKKGIAAKLPPDSVTEASTLPERSTPKGLTPDEQMALFEKDLKENDWGHQPC